LSTEGWIKNISKITIYGLPIRKNMPHIGLSENIMPMEPSPNIYFQIVQYRTCATRTPLREL